MIVTTTITLPLPEIEILTMFMGVNPSEEAIEEGASRLLVEAKDKRIVKLPPSEHTETGYLLHGAVRRIRYYDAIHDEVSERLDLAYEVSK